MLGLRPGVTFLVGSHSREGSWGSPLPHHPHTKTTLPYSYNRKLRFVMILKHSAPPSSPWFIAGPISKIWTGLTSVSNSEQWNNDQQETSLVIYTHHSFWEIGVVALNESIKWLSWLVLCLHHFWSRWSWHNCKVVAPSRLEAAQIRCFFFSLYMNNIA